MAFQTGTDFKVCVRRYRNPIIGTSVVNFCDVGHFLTPFKL